MYSCHPEKRVQFLKLKEGREIKSKISYQFQDFKKDTIPNGYFDFSLISDLQIVGLGQLLKGYRKKTTQFEFTQKLGISTKSVQYIEAGKSAVSIKVLEKILSEEKKSLMEFLLYHGRRIQYRRFRAAPVFLDLRPNAQLKYFAKKMIFYESYIRIDSDDKKLLSQIEEHFGTEIEKNLIRNGVVRYFLKTFSNLVKQENH